MLHKVQNTFMCLSVTCRVLQHLESSHCLYPHLHISCMNKCGVLKVNALASVGLPAPAIKAK